MQTTQTDLPLICPDSEEKARVIGDGDKDDGFKSEVLDASIIFTPFSHSIFMSSMSGSRNTSISLPGCRGPEIIMVSKRYLRF